METGATHQKLTLSVVIITLNEARHIGACLDSVAFADEIIVLDSGSTDQTCDIARAKGAKDTVVGIWACFRPQKNRARVQATRAWVC